MCCGESELRANKLNTVSAWLIILVYITQMIIFSSTDIVLIRQGVAYLYDDWRPALDILCAVMLGAEYVFILLCAFSVRARGAAVKFLCMYLTWLVVTRVLCGDPTLVNSVEYVRIAALCAALLCFSITLGKKERGYMLTVLAAIVFAYNLVFAFLSLVVAVTRESIQLPLGISIAVRNVGGVSCVAVVGSHRNTASMWYAAALCLAAYLFSLTRNKALRVIYIFSMPVFYAAAAISHSRLSLLALSAAVSMLVMLPVLKKLSAKKTAAKVAAALLTALIVVPLSYKSYDAVAAMMSGANVLVQPHDTAPHEASNDAEVGTSADAAGSEEKDRSPENAQPAENSEPPEELFKDTRSAADAKNLGGRVRLWRSVYTTLYFERDRLWRGSLTNDYMYTINMLSKFPNPADGEINTHNYLVEALVLTGIPGFLLLLAFSVILVVRMVRVFFYNGADVSLKLLIVLLSAILVKNMGEAFIIRTDDITNYLFFFAAGAFLAYSYELFPEKPFMIKMLQKCSGRK